MRRKFARNLSGWSFSLRRAHRSEPIILGFLAPFKIRDLPA
jgi:hypothetical protein